MSDTLIKETSGKASEATPDTMTAVRNYGHVIIASRPLQDRLLVQEKSSSTLTLWVFAVQMANVLPAVGCFGRRL
jgi:hypothetical protein